SRTATEAELVSGLDASLAEDVQITLTANRVMGLPINAVANQRLHLILTEGGVGGFALTFNAGISVTGWTMNLTAGARTEAWFTCLTPTTWLLANTPPTPNGLPVGKGGLFYDPFMYGAKVDGHFVSDVVMDGTTAVATSAGNGFAGAAAGMLFLAPGAGAAGALLVTTIASVQGPGQVTAAAVSQTAISGGTKGDVTWGADDPAAWVALHTAASSGSPANIP